MLICSCIYEDLSDCPNYNGKGEDSTVVTKAVPVEFVISTTDTTKTRSSITVSDTKVADINIYAYYDGMLEASVYEKSPQSVSLSLMNGRTVFVIAHRLSTLRNANKLVVLDHGRLAEFGTHKELLDKKGIYYHIVMAQRKAALEKQ